MKKYLSLFAFALCIYHSVSAQTFTKVSNTNPTGDDQIDTYVGVVSFNGKLLFVANDGVTGTGLYMSDGTAGGTALLKSINSISHFTDALGKLFFLGDDGVHGLELWVSDGTSAGTQMVKDINPTGGQNYINGGFSAIGFNGKLYFIADDGSGMEIWSTDGTAAGTSLLKDIYPGGQAINLAGGGGPSFTVFNNNLYFFANDGVHQRQLWKSDGTTSGTNMFWDVPGWYNESSFALTFNNRLIFAVERNIRFQYSLYVSDGTASGTWCLSDSIPYMTGQNVREVYNVVNQYPDGPFQFDGKLLFSIDGNPTYYSFTDGTVPGTMLLPVDSEGGYFGVANGKLFLSGQANANLYVANGLSPFAPVLLSPLLEYSGGTGMALTQCIGKAFFQSTYGGVGQEPWTSDGTVGGTFRLKDISPGSGDGYSRTIQNEYNGRGFFAGYNSVSGRGMELYTTDGTSAGTVKVSPPNVTTTDPLNWVNLVYDNALYLVANYDNTGYKLWKYSETGAGIQNIVLNDIQIYPVPANDVVYVKAPKGTITMSDINGNIISSDKIPDDGLLTLKIHDLASGVYLLIYQNEDVSVVRKMIKQ